MADNKEVFVAPESSRYSCEGYNSVLAWGFHDAAMIFATRAARREYGRRGFCHHARSDGYDPSNPDQRTFEAYIGVPGPDGRGCSGRNIWIYVYEKESTE